jgi:hypothetical protein
MTSTVHPNKTPPNSPMKPTATIAAQRVLRPRCLLRMAAAYWHVGQTKDGRLGLSTLSMHRRSSSARYSATVKWRKLLRYGFCS